MEAERMKILEMLQEGKVNAEQAARLLEAVEQSHGTEAAPREERKQPEQEPGERPQVDAGQVGRDVLSRILGELQSHCPSADWSNLGQKLSETISGSLESALRGVTGAPASSGSKERANYSTAKLTRARLSRMRDGTIYSNYGILTIDPDVPEELLGRKIGEYTNYGRTIGPANLLEMLEDRCEDNYGQFHESDAAEEEDEEVAGGGPPHRKNHGEARFTVSYLSHMQDGTEYRSNGTVTIDGNVSADLLTSKIASYKNYGTTTGPAHLLALLEDRGANYGQFVESE